MNEPLGDDRESFCDVIFRSPASSRFVYWVATFAILLMGGALAAIVCIVGLPLLFRYQNPPMWWLPIGGALTFIVVLLLVRYSNRAAPSRLILCDDDLRIGGILFKRRITYGDVEIIHAPTEGPDSGMTTVELRIQPRRGYRASIWLRRTDALIVVDALRGFCSSAATLEGDETISLPADPNRADDARRAVAREYRNRARIALTFAVLAGAYSIFALAALLFWASSTHYWRALAHVIVGPIVCSSLHIAFVRYRALARQIEAEPGVQQEQE